MVSSKTIEGDDVDDYNEQITEVRTDFDSNDEEGINLSDDSEAAKGDTPE